MAFIGKLWRIAANWRGARAVATPDRKLRSELEPPPGEPDMQRCLLCNTVVDVTRHECPQQVVLTPPPHLVALAEAACKRGDASLPREVEDWLEAQMTALMKGRQS